MHSPRLARGGCQPFHLPWPLPFLPQGSQAPCLGTPSIVTPTHPPPRPEKDGAATGVDAICTHRPDPVGPGLDREQLYQELSQLTRGVTRLGPYTLDPDSLYINGEALPSVSTSQQAPHPPLHSSVSLVTRPPHPFSLYLCRLHQPDPGHHPQR